MENKVAVLECGVDFLTVTTQSVTRTNALIELIFTLFGQIGLWGGGSRVWRFKGYSGYALDGVSWGKRGEEGIVMLHGHPASKYWRQFFATCDHCTRIDLAATAHLSSMQGTIAEDAYTDAVENGGRSATVIKNSGGGQTCYVGARTSRFYGRIYDKGAERKKPAGMVWRYEVEVKKPAAWLLAEQLRDAKSEFDFIKTYVYNWFYDRGVTPLWEATIAESAIEIPKPVTSDEKSLAWLKSQVAPTIYRLRFAGREQEAWEALGLEQRRLNWIEMESEE